MNRLFLALACAVLSACAFGSTVAQQLHDGVVVGAGNITPTLSDVNANVSIGASDIAKKVLVVQGKNGQTANLLDLQLYTGVGVGFTTPATATFSVRSEAGVERLRVGPSAGAYSATGLSGVDVTVRAADGNGAGVNGASLIFQAGAKVAAGADGLLLMRGALKLSDVAGTGAGSIVTVAGQALDIPANGTNALTIERPVLADILRVKATPWCDVMAYGAVGNGAADDAAAINAAISACPAGGTVFLPPGTYKVVTGITIGKQLTLRGADQGGSLIIGTGISIVTITAGGSLAAVRDLQIKDPTGDANTIGIDMQSAVTCRVSSVTVRGTGYLGIGIKFTASLENLLDHCYISKFNQGVNLISATGINSNVNTFVGGHITDNHTGIYIVGADGTSLHGVTVETNDVANIDSTYGRFSAHGCWFEVSGAPAGINIRTIGAYIGTGNMFSGAAAGLDFVCPSGANTHTSTGDNFASGITHNGTGSFVVTNPTATPSVIGTGAAYVCINTSGSVLPVARGGSGQSVYNQVLLAYKRASVTGIKPLPSVTTSDHTTAGTYITVKTQAAHGIVAGDEVRLAGWTWTTGGGAVNGWWTVFDAPTTTTFRVAPTSCPTAGSNPTVVGTVEFVVAKYVIPGNTFAANGDRVRIQYDWIAPTTTTELSYIGDTAIEGNLGGGAGSPCQTTYLITRSAANAQQHSATRTCAAAINGNAATTANAEANPMTYRLTFQDSAAALWTLYGLTLEVLK